jgi:hypothetical protein
MAIFPPPAELVEPVLPGSEKMPGHATGAGDAGSAESTTPRPGGQRRGQGVGHE